MADGMHTLVAPYALSALDEEEERQFEQHLALCERCREDLAGLREAAASLAYAAAPGAAVPPPQLKERILEQARSDRRTVIPLRRRRWTAPLAATAGIAAAAALALGIWAATRSSSQDTLASILSRPGAHLVPMGSTGGLAVAPNGEAALAVALPRAPAGKTYEAWVIRSGNAQPAGLFPGHAGTSIVRLSRPVGNRAVVAVTLERSGGVPKPTAKPLATSGKVT